MLDVREKGENKRRTAGRIPAAAMRPRVELASDEVQLRLVDYVWDAKDLTDAFRKISFGGYLILTSTGKLRTSKHTGAMAVRLTRCFHHNIVIQIVLVTHICSQQ